MKLYNYFRSSASYRVRIGLELKGLSYEYVPVHLVKGEQVQEPFASLSAERLVPLLEVDGQRLSQSMAILEYLDEVHPEPPLLPADPPGRARVRALAQDIACEIHPLNNLRVLQYLSGELGVDDAAKDAWYRHWVATGLAAVEQGLEAFGERFSLGDRPGYLEACLVPQVYNARRFACDLAPFPRIRQLAERCEALDAFRNAAPEVQPDAQ